MDPRRISALLLTLLSAFLWMAGCRSIRCAKFDDLTVGESFQVGQTITSQGVEFPLESFRASASATPVAGNATGAQVPGTQSLGLQLHSASLLIPRVRSFDNARMEFIRLGGAASFTLNGLVLPWNNVTGINGSGTGPGGLILVEAIPFATSSGSADNWIGTLTVAGPLDSLSVGGEELFLDEVCIRDEDCAVPLVDNAAVRFRTLSQASVSDERRKMTLFRLGHRPFHMSAVGLAKVRIAGGSSLSVSVAVHRFDDDVTPLASTSTTLTSSVGDNPVRIPLDFTFPQHNPFGTGPSEQYAIHVRVRSIGVDAQIETVIPLALPVCDRSGRFAFTGTQVAPGDSLVFGAGDAFRILLEGKCQ